MEFRQLAQAVRVDFPRMHPCCYVHEADVALLNDRREEAVALITLAYLAYDQMLAPRVAVTDTAWPERNS